MSDASLIGAAEHRQRIMSYQPSHPLSNLAGDMPALKRKDVFADPNVLNGCLQGLKTSGEQPAWILTVFYDMLREDSSTFCVFEDALKKGAPFKKNLVDLLKSTSGNEYVTDKAAWLLTAVMGNCPYFFEQGDVKEVMGAVMRGECSELGVLEGIVNLLKADKFRQTVWGMSGVADKVTGVDPKDAAPALLYKSIFALWMLSFEPEGAIYFKEELIIQKIRDVLINSRVEKVIRLGLTVLKNFLPHKKFTEEVVELGVLEVVQQLEYEKWRDAELYDDIREMSSAISIKVQEMSNFDRYEKELKEGKLKWGFIHSSKFWADNVLKFEQNDFKALKMLAAMLSNDDATTLAVACHDLGEFVAMHPSSP